MSKVLLIVVAQVLAGMGGGRVAAQSHSSEATPERPAWVVGDVPDTVWILMEAAVATEDEAEMKAMLLEAELHARRAAADDECSVGRRFALAAVLGMRADREGGLTKIRAASRLHDELKHLLKLDPEHAEARYMMGRLHAGVRRMGRVTRWLATNLLGGGALKEASWEEAERKPGLRRARGPAGARPSPATGPPVRRHRQARTRFDRSRARPRSHGDVSHGTRGAPRGPRVASGTRKPLESC